MDALRALGGCARAQQLRAVVGRRAVAKAVAEGAVVRDGTVYRLPATTRPLVVASTLRGTRSHGSAAEQWGLSLPPVGGSISITVPFKARRRRIPRDVVLRYRDLRPDEVFGDVTTPLRTVVDCLRDEPLRVALSVGDSALRLGLVQHDELSCAVGGLRGPGSAQARSRLAMLDARAANAFESCARAILIEAGIEGFEPQVSVRHQGQWIGRVDLANRALRIVIECDGFETHGGRDAFVKDLVRFTLLICAGWRPLRFTWEQVMFRPGWVLERIRDTITLAEASCA